MIEAIQKRKNISSWRLLPIAIGTLKNKYYIRMKSLCYFSVSKTIVSFVLLFSSFILLAQGNTPAPKATNDFWRNVQFGGGFGLAIGSGYTDITLAPSAIYNIDENVAVGLGLQGSYVSSKNYFSSAIYGASLITLFSPIEEVQFSVELEQLRVNSTIKDIGYPDLKDNFWNTGLFLGGGYRSGNVTIGARYNVLYNKNNYVYSDPFMPFVRVYF